MINYFDFHQVGKRLERDDGPFTSYDGTETLELSQGVDVLLALGNQRKLDRIKRFADPRTAGQFGPTERSALHLPKQLFNSKKAT